MPDIYSVCGVAAPEDSAEDCAAWLDWLAPAPAGRPGWWQDWHGGDGIDLPVAPPRG